MCCEMPDLLQSTCNIHVRLLFYVVMLYEKQWTATSWPSDLHFIYIIYQVLLNTIFILCITLVFNIITTFKPKLYNVQWSYNVQGWLTVHSHIFFVFTFQVDAFQEILRWNFVWLCFSNMRHMEGGGGVIYWYNKANDSTKWVHITRSLFM
jgi:hypothetical protein